MKLSGYELMYHDTPNFILEEEFRIQFWFYSLALQHYGYQPEFAMHSWLQCGESTFENLKSNLLSRSTDLIVSWRPIAIGVHLSMHLMWKD